MALYFESRVQNPNAGRTVCTSWHQRLPLVAVGTADAGVLAYNEEGEAIEGFVYKREGKTPTVLDWHPTARLLVVGWNDGCLSLFADHDKTPREEMSIHTRNVTYAKWSPDGTRLISGDKTGTIAVCKTDERYRPIVMCQHGKVGGMTHCVFRTPQMPTSPGGKRLNQPVTCPPFFIGGEAGIVFFADDVGHCSEAFNVGAPLAALLYYDQRDTLVVITANMLLAQYRIGSDGSIILEMKVKLAAAPSGQDSKFHASWIGPGLLATCSSEQIVRVWNLARDDNYVLSLTDPRCEFRTKSMADRVTAIAFHPGTRRLAMGTKEGKLIVWRYTGPDDSSKSSEESWSPILPETEVQGGKIQALQWGHGDAYLLAQVPEGVSLLNESVTNRVMKHQIAGFQLSTNTMHFERVDNQGDHTGVSIPLTANVRVRGMDITDGYALVWGGKKAEVYEIGTVATRIVSSFPSKAHCGAIRGETLYLAVGERVEVCNIQGQVKEVLAFTELEGEPVSLDINGKYLAAAAKHGVVKVWDISRREAKAHGTPLKFQSPGKKLADIVSLRCNADGSFVSILVNVVQQGGHKRPDTCIHVYNVDAGTLLQYDFGPYRYPISHSWDAVEPKLFGCETQPFKTIASDDPEEAARANSVEVVTLFATQDYDVLMQDSFLLDPSYDSLLALHVPHIFFTGKITEENPQPRLERRTMRDFVGMKLDDDQARDALLSFSYQLTIGNMDEAYKAVKLIKQASVWSNMARMCVKTKRLDVAEVCLGNMGHARGARAIREARKANLDLNAQIALVAIHLGLIDDAEELYLEADRPDLLNRLYQASGKWEKALAIAEKSDRIHLKNTHFEHGRHLEGAGDIAGAVRAYEAANVHRYQVPRMLNEQRLLSDLQAYVEKHEDKVLYKWWAQYLESTNQHDKAMSYYEKAEDFGAIARIYCFKGDFDKAAQIVDDHSSSTAAYHLARQYEAQDMLKEAIGMYQRAGRYNHAARLAKESGADSELLSLALQSNKHEMLESASYFEERGQMDKAVQLYHKGGKTSKAIDLCFRAELFDSLRMIADDLGNNTDPALLKRCGEFFMSHGQYEKSAHLLVAGAQYNDAMDLIVKHSIAISDELAEKMTLAKKAGDEAHNTLRLNLLKRLAHALDEQGSFHMATKKFTQANDKLNAMKTLLKSGDTEKIIFFAEKCRSREIYILAGNYLQTLEWHTDPGIMKSLISFYTKAKAYEQLSSFYDACSVMEIDEYRNYDKALGALKESQKWMDKSKALDKELRIAAIQQRIFIVEMFANARKLAQSNPSEMIRICEEILAETDVEKAIRVGDVYAHLIEYFYSEKMMDRAHAKIEQMRERGVVLAPYLEQRMVEDIYRSLGYDPAEILGGGGGGAGGGGIDDGIEEDIPEDF